MYKIKKFIYEGETVDFKNESFTNGKHYFIRKGIDGRFDVINMDNGKERTFRVDFYCGPYDEKLRSKFNEKEIMYFRNLKDFRNHMKLGVKIGI